MKADVRDRIDQALGEAIASHRVDLLAEPRVGAAVVADLIGDPKLDAVIELQTLRSVLHSLAEQTHDGHAEREQVIAGITTESGRSDANEMLDLVARHTDVQLIRPRSPVLSSARPAAFAVAIVAVAVVAIIILNDGNEPTPVPTSAPTAAPTTTTGTSTAAPDPTTSLPPTTGAAEASPGITASFAQLKEGPFLVTRGWRVTPGDVDIVGIVILESATGAATTGSHRELPPPLAVVSVDGLRWSPDPSALFNTVAVFDVTLSAGQAMEIEFRAPLTLEGPISERDVLAWYDNWATSATDIRPFQDSDPLAEPILSPGG